MRKILVCALAAAFSGCIYPFPEPDIATEPVVVPQVTENTPSAELQVLVSPLRELGMSKQDAAKTAKFFLDFADVLSRDDSVLKTTADIREGYIRAETLMLQRTDMVGKYPGFGKVKDNILAETLGLDRLPLTLEKRTKAVEAFKAMAWALGG